MKRERLLKMITAIAIVAMLLILPNAKVEAAMENNNPLLVAITVDGKPISQEFDQFITDYVIAVDGDQDEVKIEATTDDPNASYKVIGDTKLKEGVNDFEIKVTAEDGTTTYSYFLHITRGDTKKANANLKNIEIEGLDLNPKFNEKDTSYLVEYEGYIKQLKIKATPESDKAKIEILDNEGFNSTLHVVTIKVTAEDGVTTKEYKINAKKAGESLENPTGLEQYEEELKKESKVPVWMIIIAAIVVVVVIIFVAKNKTSKRNKKRRSK